MRLTKAIRKRLDAIEGRLGRDEPVTMDADLAAALLSQDASDAVFNRTGDERLERRAAIRWMLETHADILAGRTTAAEVLEGTSKVRPPLTAADECPDSEWRPPTSPRELSPEAAAMLDQLIRDVGGDPSKSPPNPLPVRNRYRNPRQNRNRKGFAEYD